MRRELDENRQGHGDDGQCRGVARNLPGEPPVVTRSGQRGQDRDADGL
jgi:hypothetical protein